MLGFIVLFVMLMIAANVFFKDGAHLFGWIATIGGGLILGIICFGIVIGAFMINPILGIITLLIFRAIGKRQRED